MIVSKKTFYILLVILKFKNFMELSLSRITKILNRVLSHFLLYLSWTQFIKNSNMYSDISLDKIISFVEYNIEITLQLFYKLHAYISSKKINPLQTKNYNFHPLTIMWCWCRYLKYNMLKKNNGCKRKSAISRCLSIVARYKEEVFFHWETVWGFWQLHKSWNLINIQPKFNFLLYCFIGSEFINYNAH